MKTAYLLSYVPSPFWKSLPWNEGNLLQKGVKNSVNSFLVEKTPFPKGGRPKGGRPASVAPSDASPIDDQDPHAYSSLYLFIFSFSPIEFFFTDFSALMRASLQILYTPTEGWSILCKRKSWCWNLFCFLFSFLYSNVIHIEICVKDSSGTAAPRILKFGTNVEYDLVLYKRELASSCLSFPLFVHFSFAPVKVLVTDFSGSMRASFQIFYCRPPSKTYKTCNNL